MTNWSCRPARRSHSPARRSCTGPAVPYRPGGPVPARRSRTGPAVPYRPGGSQPASQPTNSPTNQPTSQPLAGLGWLGWPVICAKTNKTKVNQANPSRSTLKTKKT